MTVARLEEESTPNVTRDAIAAVDALKPSLPPGIMIEPVYDQGHLVEESIDSVREAIIIGAFAGERRIRPIAMTTLATPAGLAPLALGIGAGAELQRPLALAVIGGLSLSSLLSSLALPSIAGGLHRLGVVRPRLEG
jgi:multidrug efflux pump subunit AcrB